MSDSSQKGDHGSQVEGAALEVLGVSKSYGATVALREASFSVASGSIHALIGENGAGKSTLVKILSGLVEPDEGTIRVGAQAIGLRTPRAAIAAGVSTAFQELTLVPKMTVAQNLLLGREPRSRLGLISDERMNRLASEILAEWDLPDVSPTVATEDFALGVRQQIELVRAFSRHGAVLLLDEPTAALAASQVDWLFAQIQKVRATGVAIVFISHRMDEIRDICDAGTVLRNGQQVSTFNVADVSDDEVIQMMVGHSLAERIHTEPPHVEPTGTPVLSVRHLQRREMADVSFDLYEGEVLGLAALQGHGQLELFNTLFGALRPSGGEMSIRGRKVRITSPRQAVRHGLGINLVPEDRKAEGVLTGMSSLVNVTLPNLQGFSRFGFLRRKHERGRAAEIFKLLNLRPTAMHSNVATLSGGNQQKVAIGKWMLSPSDILLMYDPTRGVDVGTKAEIFDLMQSMADDGRAILFYSTDLAELLAVCGRILVMYKGKVVADLTGAERNHSAALAAMVGSAQSADPASSTSELVQ
ncbi:sugar ABC transporter ATP-binding protein [Aeromicrobium sp. A1-2]|uniref:sugar ABC transporter ATP-binding protein n=1 Tax=Aeromicrobium sp. A1-2 TaxID=2107713 RepID=UPI000E52C770|nr:sugar ABC transporter ATP-binding protein [Aeromicrobium sp. A1-2]AXT86445.1 sugar ABC transporter ATP-binding protein [Aeromicrobium sp. A1-2]